MIRERKHGFSRGFTLVIVVFCAALYAVGFWFPSSMDGVDFAVYHLHLITDSHSAGGHLLDCIVRNATVEIDQTCQFNMVLP
jgi:alpha-acetolactate decarboxylase